jgi:pentatricopeptide repeat protein
MAKKFWDDVIWPSGRHDAFVYAAFLKGLCQSGYLSDACHFLYDLADSGAIPNVVCYNTVIAECSRSGLKREAYQILEEMRKNGQAPDAVTWRILDKLHDSMDLTVERELISNPATSG